MCGTASHFVPQSITKIYHPLSGKDATGVAYTLCDCKHLQDQLVHTMLHPTCWMLVFSVQTLSLHCAAANA